MEPYISPEEFKEHYEKIPEDLQESIFSETTAQKIERISNDHNAGRLMSEIARLTGRVMLGVLPLDRFISALSEHTGIGMDSASEIAQDINRQIFFPVRDSLRSLYGLGQTDIVSAPAGGGVIASKSAFPGARSPDQLIIPQRKGEIKFEKPSESMEHIQAPEQPSSSKISATETWEDKQPAQSETKESNEPPHDLPTVGGSPASKPKDIYKEPLGEVDVGSKFENAALGTQEKPKPRIDGNIIDLKTLNTD